ncbi:long-chain-fatty-acid--CoA ligase [Pseudofrankia asymbiotica]|uniref:Long-chain fatty acid--CoA ligase n=1 Tax=Pseudofrankia asymbiotica TaxID=1834516 RepID=A0A1V2I985_9ACTN|nr:long-chain-fatty-acid--CoA ligase [Pseudofrankia asymbiotica]ONH28830.1 long-chain fatty acid--CoA ligase [Pseudofrankia asymbiotica]
MNSAFNRVREAGRRARLQGGRIVFLGQEDDDELPWPEFFAQAEDVAAWLQNVRGLGRGGRVVILGLPSRPVVTALVGAWLAGASVTVAPTPARTTDLQTYVGQTLARLAALGEPLVLLGAPYDALADALVAGGAHVELLADALAAEPVGVWKAPDLTADDPAILQFTSGTTSTPKIVRVSHGNLAANIAAIRERIRHDEVHDRLLTWLPLSHDMGLIGALAVQLTCGHCDVLISSPNDYLASPSSWMRNAARYRATVLMGPASAYAMAGRLLKTGPALDLSCVKVALSGGEPIDPEAIEAFLDAAARHGFRREAFLPAYGLAEATLAVTMPDPYRGLRVDEVDADILADQRRAEPALGGRRTRRFARLGEPVPGTRVRIVDPVTDADRPQRSVGEIQVAGPSIAGYLTETPDTPDVAGGDAGDGGHTHSRDRWLATGDVGYLVDGELVVCGRAKDLIIIGGRNIHPEEAEQAAATVPGVRPGNAVAFATRRGGAATDSVTVAFELRPGHDETDVRGRVTAAVLAAVGVRPAAVHALPPGSIPKTPSGKLQRAEAARLWGGEQ